MNNRIADVNRRLNSLSNVWWCALVWVLVGIAFILALGRSAVPLPSESLGLRRFQISIDPHVTVSQTFTMPVDGLQAIEIVPSGLGDSVSGKVLLELHADRAGVVRSAEVSAASLTASSTYRFAFEAINDSKNNLFRLDLRSSENDPVKGVAVWATKGEGSVGALLVNDRERWANLAFSTFAPAGRSSWHRLMDSPALERGRVRGHVVIVALAVYWIAFGAGLFTLWNQTVRLPLKNEAVILAALLAVFVCRVVVADAIVPPWQGPDEPGHFTRAYGLTLPASMEQPIEANVLRSMVRHRWWELYDDPPPSVLTSFDHAPNVGGGTLAQPLYYSLGAIGLAVSRPADLDTAYSHLRFLSVLLAMVALAFGWAGTRLLFGAEIATGALAVGALHPQFLLAALAVNPDALLNVWGALVWWQAARVATGHRRGFSAALMLVAAVAAVFTKRIGFVLVGVSVVVGVMYFRPRRTWNITGRDAFLMTATGVAGAAILLAFRFLAEGQQFDYWAYWKAAVTVTRPLDNTTFAEAFRFARMTVDYFWLIAGWLRFQPPQSWLWAARVLILGGMVGALVVVAESRESRGRLSIAWLFVGAQLVAMLVAVFLVTPSAPQARYLFPVFTPITVLLYVGLQRIFPGRLRANGPAVLLAVLVIMDVTGFTTVHIPTYLS